MTPKEKAEKLVHNFKKYSYYPTTNDDVLFVNQLNYNAKKCALIAVDEMLGNAAMIWGGRNTDTGLTARDEFRKYWNEVKQEIEKI
jgi:hypothetical protein